MIAYLAANGFQESAAAMRAEMKLGEEEFDIETTKKYETLLQKKWTSVVRLQKKACIFPPLDVGLAANQFL